jgi:hypothetical protein
LALSAHGSAAFIGQDGPLSFEAVKGSIVDVAIRSPRQSRKRGQFKYPYDRRCDPDMPLTIVSNKYGR